jgi:2-dehydro-3-deoxygluconokinase
VTTRRTADVDVVSFGETMISFVGTQQPSAYTAIAAGAESNVAIGMARLGCSTRWVSRVGDDPLGRLVVQTVEAAGVEVLVAVDPDHPTGVMVKHPAGEAKRSSYYRSESAARGLSPSDRQRFGTARWVHASGITPALSDSAHALVESVLDEPEPIAGSVSFDINHRPSLWASDTEAASVLLPLARRADLVFIGEDEAMALLGSSTPSEVAGSLAADSGATVVLKHGPGGATAITDGEQVFAPALPSAVVDTTGAGDAFAAGYLAGTCLGWPMMARLRLGHELASRVVGSVSDAVGPIATAERVQMTPDALAAQWAKLEPPARRNGGTGEGPMPGGKP